MGSIQNKTPADIHKFSYVIRSFILNTPDKKNFGVWYSKTPKFRPGERALKVKIKTFYPLLVSDIIVAITL